MLKSGRNNGSVTNSLGSPVINELRSKYLRSSKSAAELSAELGVDHYQVINLREEIAQYERSILKELERISKAYASDLEVARARAKNLNGAMSSLIKRKAASNETMVRLRELEREAEVFSNSSSSRDLSSKIPGCPTKTVPSEF